MTWYWFPYHLPFVRGNHHITCPLWGEPPHHLPFVRGIHHITCLLWGETTTSLALKVWEESTTSLALCERNPPHHLPFVRGINSSLMVSPHKGPVIWSYDVFFVVSLNNLLHKQYSWQKFDVHIWCLCNGVPCSASWWPGWRFHWDARWTGRWEGLALIPAQVNPQNWWHPAGPSENKHTVRCHYNAINFVTDIHKRYPISRLLGWGMGCLL